MKLESKRLMLRYFTPQDWQAVHAYTSDAAVMTYIPGGHMTAEQTKAFVAENGDQEARAFPLILKSESRLIGHLNFHPWFAPRTYEVGWVIHPAYHGRGYATEAAHELLRYGFEGLDCHRIIATCQPENIASWRVMEKLDMRREGHFQKCIDRGNGVWWDEYFYAILQEEWVMQGS